MSMFGSDEKDYLYEEIKDYLKTHKTYELLEIITAVFEYNDGIGRGEGERELHTKHYKNSVTVTNRGGLTPWLRY